MEEGNKGTKKIVWIVLFTFITVLLCYMFVVLYFFYISPYNIAAKTTVWPFFSKQTLCEMYMDATVELTFSIEDEETFEGDIPVSTLGVNVRKNGIIVAPYTKFRELKADSQVKIAANTGKVFDGEFLYSDENYGVAIFKCVPIDSDEEVKLPYAKLPSRIKQGDVLAIDVDGHYSGTVASEPFVLEVPQEVDGKEVVDFVLENCYQLQGNKIGSNCLVFDKSGTILGFSCETVDEYDEEDLALISLEGVESVVNAVVRCFEEDEKYFNSIKEKFVGFDTYEALYYINDGDETEKFYFNNEWQTISEEMISFRLLQKYYYLFEDFVYGEAEDQVTIAKNNVITRLKVGRKTFDVFDKMDLLKVLYSLENGDKLTIYYQGLGENAQSQSVQIVV